MTQPRKIELLDFARPARPSRRPAKTASRANLTTKRIKAFVVDLAFVFVVSLIMAETLVRLLPVSAGVLWLTAPFVFPLILLGYFAATEGSALAASLGKRLYGLRVRLKDGRRLGYRSAFIRALAFYLTVTLLTPLILVLVPMTRGRRALHDVFVGGMVVDNLAAVRRS